MLNIFLESWASILGRTKDVRTLYWMMLWMKHQRALKLLNCLHLVVMATFRWSISQFFFRKNQCALSLNSDYIVIFKNPQINNLLLSQDKHVPIKWSSLCGLTKTQMISTYLLDAWFESRHQWKVSIEKQHFGRSTTCIYSTLKEKQHV